MVSIPLISLALSGCRIYLLKRYYQPIRSRKLIGRCWNNEMGIRATTARLLIDGFTIILVDAAAAGGAFWWGADSSSCDANSGQFSSSWNNGQILVEKVKQKKNNIYRENIFGRAAQVDPSHVVRTGGSRHSLVGLWTGWMALGGIIKSLMPSWEDPFEM